PLHSNFFKFCKSDHRFHNHQSHSNANRSFPKEEEWNSTSEELLCNFHEDHYHNLFHAFDKIGSLCAKTVIENLFHWRETNLTTITDEKLRVCIIIHCNYNYNL